MKSEKIFVESYKGFIIERESDKVTCNIADHSGNIVNKTTPYYLLSVKSTKKWYNTAYCYTNLIDIDKSIAHLKMRIDERIESERQNKLTRINNRLKSKHATYICNNVTIRVLFDMGIGGDYSQLNTNIYVNERPLRGAYLRENFTFEDVLMQVYINTISKYNMSDYSSELVKKNYFKIHTTETIDLTILPVYEYLGKLVKLGNETFSPHNVRRDYQNNVFKFEVFGGETKLVSLNDVKNLEIVGETNNLLCRMSALMKYSNFVE